MASLAKKLDEAWFRPRKGSPPITFAECSALLRELTAAEQRLAWFDQWRPTVSGINGLPEPIRRYILDLANKCEPAADLPAMVDLREQVDALRNLVNELEQRLMEARELQRLPPVVLGPLDSIGSLSNPSCQAISARYPYGINHDLRPQGRPQSVPRCEPR
jgi:hypothetical protein